MSLSTANISVRDYIYFLPYPAPRGTPIPYTPGLPHNNPLSQFPYPTEPTSTLVLTSTTAQFVDLRFVKPLEDSEPALPPSGVVAREDLQWAFAGASKSWAKEVQVPDRIEEEDEEEDGDGDEGDGGGDAEPTVKHSVWTHWLDSNWPVGATHIPVDEGDMYPMPDGRTLEVGASMMDGRMQGYEEMWSDVPIKACFPSPNKYSIVMRVELDAAGVRGLIVRVGQFCQGILMHGSEPCTVERWEFVESKNEAGNVTGGDWKRTAKVGELFLPCALAFAVGRISAGMKVKTPLYEWVVEELVEWQG
ncbi:hypothetical protein BDV95DRAFT_570803 [Massariosphaeria phaeospora]|uniref:Protein HRI1 n=1 Tax=Massariosphaeria phaeospora TaxID=100035 RepID=A0A7C8MPE0_9PLEO|nr:hypothetical protein BDV95DRAFT_570803 [Massariosphaeria phaeospora]